ncbi:hypothetical protein ES703_88503 [subsurface metagenome]
MNDEWYSLDPGGEMTQYGLTIPPAQYISPQIYNWPAEAFIEPSPVEKSWLSPILDPFDKFGQNLWTAGTRSIEQVSENLPDLLWGWGLRELGGVINRPKESVVREGSGVSVIYTDAPHAGGEPAQPAPSIIPGQWPIMPTWMAPAAGVPQAKVPTALLLVGAGLVVAYVLLKR